MKKYSVNIRPLSHMLIPVENAVKVAPKVDQDQVNDLLMQVMAGEQDKAEKMIRVQPLLLLLKGSGKEWHNGREFNNITAFQYALWALDWRMWRMMMKYMDSRQALYQLEELGFSGTEHGQHFDFGGLLNAYQGYLDETVWEKCKTQWITMVSESQKQLPIHVLQEYFRSDRPMSPIPDFTVAHRKGGALDFNNKDWARIDYSGFVRADRATMDEHHTCRLRFWNSIILNHAFGHIDSVNGCGRTRGFDRDTQTPILALIDKLENDHSWRVRGRALKR